MQILEFIFSSFWIWLGVILSIGAICKGIALIILALRGKWVNDDSKLIDIKIGEK